MRATPTAESTLQTIMRKFLLRTFVWIGARLFRSVIKILALILIVCGIAPMFHHPAEFVGLPMTAAGIFGLFVSDKARYR